MCIMASAPRNLNEVQKVITSLLTAEKKGHGIDIVEFDRMYNDYECERIPFKSFGYSSLAEFLQTVPGVEVKPKYNGYVIYFIGKETTKHLSQLVAKQRSNTRNVRGRSLNNRSIASHYITRSRTLLPSRCNNINTDDILNIILDYPRGVSKHEIIRIYLHRHPHSNFDNQKLLINLNTLKSKVIIRENMVYPSRNTSTSKCSTSRSNSVPPRDEDSTFVWNINRDKESGIIPNNYKVIPDSCDEDFDYINDDNLEYVTPTSVIKEQSNVLTMNDNVTKTNSKLNDKSTSNNEKLNDNKENIPIKSNAEFHQSNNNKTFDENEFIFSKNKDEIAILLNDRTQFRLKKLIQNNPDGIWCMDLPKKYREEYKIPLEWETLGFQRIGDFAAYLPHIFQISGPLSNGDFRLYNAELPIPSSAKENHVKHQKSTLASIYNVYNSDDDVEAVPSTIPLSLSNQLMPDDVLVNGETVGQISVTTFNVCHEINDKRSMITVRILEAFSPSFFWIQIEKKRQKFDDMMAHLHEFYEEKKAKYSVPIIMLEKGLNIACIFYGKWHRGIIKAVDHKCQVSILFYDYGTLKTYSPENIFYLHRKFSALPAQAIPCGLYNVKPFEGDTWPKSTIDIFIKQVYDRPVWAFIGKIDIEKNSMQISLTDTSQDEDFHIADWMLQKKLARPGHMDMVDPMDLNNYQEDYGDIADELIKSDVNDNQTILIDNTMKLPSDISINTVKNLYSALSIMEAKHDVALITMDNIKNFNITMRNVILRYFEMILSMNSILNNDVLTNMSETLSKIIMDNFHSTSMIIQSNDVLKLNDIQLSLSNSQVNGNLNKLMTNVNIESQSNKCNGLLRDNNTMNSMNSMNMPDNKELSIQSEIMINDNGINKCKSIDTIRSSSDKSYNLNNIPKQTDTFNATNTINDVTLTDEISSNLLNSENNVCPDVNIDTITHGITELNRHKLNNNDTRTKFEMSITNVCNNFFQRQELNAIFDNFDEQQYKIIAKNFDDTNPFKKEILSDINCGKSVKIPPPLPPRNNKTISINCTTDKSMINTIYDNNQKIVYQSPPILYNLSNRDIQFKSPVKAKSNTSKNIIVNKHNDENSLEFEYDYFSKIIKKLGINHDDDDIGYQSEIPSSTLRCGDVERNNRQSVILNGNNLHYDKQMNNNFIPVQLTKCTTCLFNINHEGWIPVTQFRSAFTEFGDNDGLYRFLNIAMPEILICIIKRFDNLQLFDQYDRFMWNLNKSMGRRNKSKKCEELAIIKLSTIMKILMKMSIITKAEIEAHRTRNTILIDKQSAMIDVVKLISVYGAYQSQK